MPERSIRSLISWRLVIAIAVMLHLDWHVARPHGMHFSGAWQHHWILGLLTLSAAAWFVVRKWPHAPWSAAAVNLGIAILLAQIVEPIVYGLIFEHGSPPMNPPFFWQAFGEFLLGGIFAFVAILLFYRRGRTSETQAPIDR